MRNQSSVRIFQDFQKRLCFFLMNGQWLLIHRILCGIKTTKSWNPLINSEPYQVLHTKKMIFLLLRLATVADTSPTLPFTHQANRTDHSKGILKDSKRSSLWKTLKPAVIPEPLVWTELRCFTACILSLGANNILLISSYFHFIPWTFLQ